MKVDSLKMDNVIPVLSVVKEESNVVWLYYAIGVSMFLVCVCFGLWRYFHSERFRLKRQLQQGEGVLNFKDTMDNAFGAKTLYDKLKGKCHPDNFSTDLILFEKATEIFALLVKNKYNYNELSQLKERAERELNINI